MPVEAKYFGILNERKVLADYLVLPTVQAHTLEAFREEGLPILAKRLREKGAISRELQSVVQEGATTPVEASFHYLYKKLAVNLLDTAMHLRGLSFDRFILYTDMAAGVLLTGLTYSRPGELHNSPAPDEAFTRNGVTPMTKEQDATHRFVQTINGIVVAASLKEDPTGYTLVEEVAKNVRGEATQLAPERSSTKEFIPQYLQEGTKLAVGYYKGIYPVAEGLFKYTNTASKRKRK